MTATPAAALLEAARALSTYTPESPAELAETLRALNELTDADSLIDLLTDALDHWATIATNQTWPNGEAIADGLLGASERLGAIGQHLDRAREATGHWNN